MQRSCIIGLQLDLSERQHTTHTRFCPMSNPDEERAQIKLRSKIAKIIDDLFVRNRKLWIYVKLVFVSRSMIVNTLQTFVITLFFGGAAAVISASYFPSSLKFLGVLFTPSDAVQQQLAGEIDYWRQQVTNQGRAERRQAIVSRETIGDALRGFNLEMASGLYTLQEHEIRESAYRFVVVDLDFGKVFSNPPIIITSFKNFETNPPGQIGQFAQIHCQQRDESLSRFRILIRGPNPNSNPNRVPPRLRKLQISWAAISIASESNPGQKNAGIVRGEPLYENCHEYFRQYLR